MLAVRNLYMRCVSTMSSTKVQVLGEPSDVRDPQQRLELLEACLGLICERITTLGDIEVRSSVRPSVRPSASANG